MVIKPRLALASQGATLAAILPASAAATGTSTAVTPKATTGTQAKTAVSGLTELINKVTDSTAQWIKDNTSPDMKKYYEGIAQQTASSFMALVNEGCMTPSYAEHLIQSNKTALAQASGDFFTPAATVSELQQRWSEGTISAHTYWEQANSSGLSGNKIEVSW
ncbi:MAG: hypothetical protein KO464_07205 [Candidatus Methanofastidiosum sp.]|nr:hypothetical protein [Methanofastidiosum sp.]